jgi:hypothetical protein
LSDVPPRFPWCPVEQWEPVTAPLTNGSDNRTPQRYAAVLEQFEIEKNPRYQPVGDKTFCATLTWDVTRALGCEVPHWVFGKEISANDLEAWFATAGRRQLWREVIEAEAMETANKGLPTVVNYRNKSGGHGHVAMLRPQVLSDIGPQIAQAGTICFTKGKLEDGFGRLPVRLYTHV